jgi:hypothetical protein
LSTIIFLVVLCTALLASAAATLRLDKTSNLPGYCLVDDSFDIHPTITTFWGVVEKLYGDVKSDNRYRKNLFLCFVLDAIASEYFTRQQVRLSLCFCNMPNSRTSASLAIHVFFAFW